MVTLNSYNLISHRLTKYQLLLESLLATVTSGETEADAARLRLALHTAKDVLHTVDTAVRTAENEHRCVMCRCGFDTKVRMIIN